MSVFVGMVVFLGTMTTGCDDNGGVPSWQRCRSWLGNPIVEWPGGNLSPLFSLAIGIGAGYLVWRRLGKSGQIARVTSIVITVGLVLAISPIIVSAFTT